MKYISNSLEDTEKIAQQFVVQLVPKESGATVVGLYGNLGAGKTAFTKCVASSLGIEESITSPTFVIEKIYELQQSVASSQHQGKITSNQNLDTSYLLRATSFTHLIHIDAYRLEKSAELIHLGWNEIISEPHNLILIEWPENVADIMPGHIKITLKPLENVDSRQIEIEL